MAAVTWTDGGAREDAVATGVRGPIVATALLFAANGAVFGAIVPRLPDLKDALDLGPAAFGLAMACYPAGALVGGLLTPALMRRRSDGAVAVAAMIAASAIVALVGFSPALAVFAGLLLLFGLCDAITDVSMNAHGIRVQSRHGRSLINRFHAVWSLGAALGAAGGSVAAGVGTPVVLQMIAAGVASTVAALAAFPLRLGPPGAEHGSGRGARPRTPARATGRTLLLLAALGQMACCAAIVEDFAQTWSALYLREVAAAGAGLAGLGFIAVQGMQLVGRLTGDRLVEGVGAAHVGRMGGACVVAGSGAALVASFALDGPVLVAALLVGSALAGWGIATIIPGAMVAADSVPGLAPGTGLAVLNWVIRLGFLASPPVVGLIAEHAGMRWTVAPLIVGGVLIALMAGPLLGRADRAPVDRARPAGH